MARAARSSASVIGAAGVCRREVGTAHREHRCAAVAADQKAGVGVVVLFDAAVVRAGALLPQSAGGSERAIVNNRLMVVFNHDLFALIAANILAVDFRTGIFALPQRTDVKIVIQNALYGDDRPCSLGFSRHLLALRFFAHALGHARRRNALLGQVVCNFLVAPALIVIQVENLADGFCLGRHDLKLLAAVDDVAVGRGAQPLTVCLTALDDVSHLARSIGDRHFVDEKLKLDLQPVVIVRKVNAVSDGNNAHACVAQIFQLDQTARVAAGESGEILDDEDVVSVAHQSAAHLLIALALLERVAGAVAVLEKRQRTAGEVRLYVVVDNGLLVLDGDILLVLLIVNGNAAVACYVKGFGHAHSPLRYFSIWRSNSELFSFWK